MHSVSSKNSSWYFFNCIDGSWKSTMPCSLYISYACSINSVMFRIMYIGSHFRERNVIEGSKTIQMRKVRKRISPRRLPQGTHENPACWWVISKYFIFYLNEHLSNWVLDVIWWVVASQKLSWDSFFKKPPQYNICCIASRTISSSV